MLFRSVGKAITLNFTLGVRPSPIISYSWEQAGSSGVRTLSVYLQSVNGTPYVVVANINGSSAITIPKNTFLIIDYYEYSATL